MKKIASLLSLLFLAGTLVPTPPTDATSAKPTIYVSIVSHNEEPNGTTHPDFTSDYDNYKTYRDATVNFATMLKSEGVKYNFQSDWNFLLAEQEDGTTFSNTGNKNLLQWLVNTEGFEVNPHAHESKYSYADVAYLMTQLGITPAKIIGGFIATPASSSKIEDYQGSISGMKYNTTWTPDALWGPASGNHTDDSSLWISGIWRPKSNSEFTTDDSSNKPVIGGYTATWDGLDDLLSKRDKGELDANKMYTITIMTNQEDGADQSFIDEFQSEIESHQSYTDSGAIQWVTLSEALDIWESDYDSTPTIYSYDDGDLSPASTTSSTSSSTTTSSSTGTTNSSTSDDFTDVSSSNEYYDAISYVHDNGIVEGYSDGTYKPDQAINRAEFTKILIEAAHPGEATRAEACFTDIDSSAWYAKYVCFAKVYNIVSGYSDGTYKASQNINVAEALKITLLTYFHSIPETSGEWYQKYWDYADSNGYLLSAWSSPAQNLTRGEMAELIYRIKN